LNGNHPVIREYISKKRAGSQLRIPFWGRGAPITQDFYGSKWVSDVTEQLTVARIKQDGQFLS
jgi:hypothetical protein